MTDNPSDNPSADAFDDFFDDLDLPETDCEQVHPLVEQFVATLDFSNEDWGGSLSDWMEQANSCLTNEIVETLGEPPQDPEAFSQYLWSAIRISWLFYGKFHSGAPFNT